MHKLLLLFLSLFCTLFARGQKLHILEKESKFPIERVFVHDDTNTYLSFTDKNGIVDLSKFPQDAVIHFQHIAYIDRQFTKGELAKIHYKLYLENASEQIQEVVLSVSKSKENRKRVAEQIEVVTQYEIQEISPQTSADLLAQTPGVKVQKSQFGGGSPILRGMEANRVLLVVDGVRLNNAIYRKGHLQNAITVSPNLLSRMEVLFGPSSILYGSDALGGVIHYYTKKPHISETPCFNSTAFSRYSNSNNEISMSYTGEYSSKKWASLTGISFSKFGDLKMGKNRVHGFTDWGLVPYYSTNSDTYYQTEAQPNSDPNIQRNTGFSQIDLLQKILIPLSKKTQLNFNFQYSTSSDIPRFDKLNEYKDDNLHYAEWYYGPQKRFLASSQLQLNPDKKWMKTGQLIISYQDIYETRQERKFTSLNTYFRNENVKVWSATGDFHVPLLTNDKRILSYGFETSYNKVQSKAIGKVLAVDGHSITGYTNTFDIPSRFPDGGSSYTNFALYTDYRLDHNTRGTLNIGLRFTNTFLKAKWIDTSFITLPEMEISLSNAAFSGTIGYIYKPNKKWKLSSVLSSGFRSPNIDDIGKIREKRGKVSVPNTHLKPEYAYNAEIGALYHISKKSWVGFNSYYTLLTQYINRDLYSINGQNMLLYDGEWATSIANVNKGNAYIVGATLSLQTKLSEHLKFKSSTSFTKGATYDTKEPLSSIPPLFGNAKLSYQLNKWNFALDYHFNAHKKSSNYNISEGIDNIEETPIIDPIASDMTEKYYGTPAWQTFSFSSQLKLTRHINTSLFIDNIFDIHYKEFASGVSAPGRNIAMTLHARF